MSVPTSPVKLVAATRGCGVLDNRSAEDVVSYAARVSNPQNQDKFDTAPKLLAYCLREKHYSIFETASMTLEITTSRAIADQLLRHRSATFQQHSQRYAASDTYIQYDARRQDLKNRQNSVADMSDADQDWFKEAQQDVWDLAYTKYKSALQKGIAKESARFLLPLNTQTTLFMTMNIRSWIHYIELRSGNGTQKEHQDIALAAQAVFVDQFPSIAAALGWKS